MAKQFPALTDQHTAFIAKQHMFFVATATADSRVNLSPKGLGGFRVLGPNQCAYLDLTGSGNETAAHLHNDGRITIMFCAFEGAPLILRLYGRGRSAFRGDETYAALLKAHFADQEPAGARQIVIQDIDLVQTSCGFGVPRFEYEGERSSLLRWAESKTLDELRAYRADQNSLSLDGAPTGLPSGT